MSKRSRGGILMITHNCYNCTTCENRLCIAKIPLFEELSKTEQQEIFDGALHFDCEQGITIVNEGDKANYILILREGKVKLNRFDLDGKEYILDIKVKKDLVGDEYLLKNTNFNYNVETIEASKFCKISTKVLFDKAKKNPDFSEKMIINLASELQESNNKLLLMMETNALFRIVGFLLRQNRKVANGEIILSLDDLAGLINLRKETVSRKIKLLEKQGCLKRIGHKKIKILDSDKLEDILTSY